MPDREERRKQDRARFRALERKRDGDGLTEAEMRELDRLRDDLALWRMAARARRNLERRRTDAE